MVPFVGRFRWRGQFFIFFPHFSAPFRTFPLAGPFYRPLASRRRPGGLRWAAPGGQSGIVSWGRLYIIDTHIVKGENGVGAGAGPIHERGGDGFVPASWPPVGRGSGDEAVPAPGLAASRIGRGRAGRTAAGGWLEMRQQTRTHRTVCSQRKSWRSPPCRQISSRRFPRLMTPVAPKPRRRRMAPSARILNAQLARHGVTPPVLSSSSEINQAMV